ncbi:MAG TPA: single-stranded DNA-binding protein [Bryobacteraceae bacterium]|nr:single-stranded DNA-binding protein [Bryobacteraceae bacterium]
MAERSVNKVILIGRIGANAESKVTQNGTPVSRLSLAMNRQWTDSDQQVHEETDWIPVVIWNKEKLSEYLSRGSRLYIEGRLQTRSYEDDGGVKRYITEVIAHNVVSLGGSSNGSGNGSASRNRADGQQKVGKAAAKRQSRAAEAESEELDTTEVPF